MLGFGFFCSLDKNFLFVLIGNYKVWVLESKDGWCI